MTGIGGEWSPRPTPGVSGNHLIGLAAVSRHDVWAVGQRNGVGADVPLVEHWNGHAWSVVRTPVSSGQGACSTESPPVGGIGVHQPHRRDDLRPHPLGRRHHYDAAAVQKTIIIRCSASGSHDVGAPSPGSGDSTFGGIAAAGRDLWAMGCAKDAGGREPLIEHHRTR